MRTPPPPSPLAPTFRFKGKVFDSNYTRESVAAFMRRKAERGLSRSFEATPEELEYTSNCSGIYVPDTVSLIFTRDQLPDEPKTWHLSMSKYDLNTREYVDPPRELLVQWAAAFFPDDLHRVKFVGPQNPQGRDKHVFHILLEVENW